MASKHSWSLDQRIAHYTAPPDRNGCTVWVGSKTKRGYPKLGYRRKCITVTRVVLAKKLGRPLKPGSYACHTCDNPSCCTPSHLFEGTQKDNQADMVRKGRSLRGERHNMAKLTVREVRQIRRLLGRSTKTALARKFNVSTATIRMIELGRVWSHVK